MTQVTSVSAPIIELYPESNEGLTVQNQDAGEAKLTRVAIASLMDLKGNWAGCRFGWQNLGRFFHLFRGFRGNCVKNRVFYNEI